MTCVLFGFLGAVLLCGCAGQVDTSCSNNTECDPGSVCSSGVCKPASSIVFAISPAAPVIEAVVGVTPAPLTVTLTDSSAAGHTYYTGCDGAVSVTPASGLVSQSQSAQLILQASAPSAAGTTSSNCDVSTPTDSAAFMVFKVSIVASAAASGSQTFSLSIAGSGALSAAPGGARSAVLSVVPAGGFSSDVSLAVSGAPSGSAASFNTSVVSGGAGAAELTLQPGSGAAPAAGTLTVTASGGGVTQTANLDYTIVASSGCTSLSWSSYSQGFFTANCTSCHSSYQTYSGVLSDAAEIDQMITAGAMPLNGTLSSSDEQNILQWLACGLPQ